jgi:hypothetical protein
LSGFRDLKVWQRAEKMALEIAYEIDYLDDTITNELLEECQGIGKMQGGLIKARN